MIQSQNKSHEKKISTLEGQLKSSSQQMTFATMKSTLAVGVTMIAGVNLMGTYFKGVIIAILPFEPFSLLRGITHRNIEGENYYECAYLFIYIMCTFIIRANVKKIFGIESFLLRSLDSKGCNVYVLASKIQTRMISKQY